MPKLLFVVDHIFGRTGDGSVFTIGGKFPYSAWRSYLETFDKIKVLSRVKDIDAAEDLSLSSGPDVDFVLTDGARGLKRIIHKSRFNKIVRKEVESSDLVVARLPSELGLAACKFARATRKPYLIEVVACPWDALWYHGSILPKIYAPILWLRTRLAVKRAPVVRYVTREFLQRRYPTDGEEFVASNVLLPPIESERAPRKRQLTNEGKVVLGTIGAMHTRLKGIQTAIAALAQLRAAHPNIRFEYRVLGEGDHQPFAAEAQKLGIAEDVSFYGTLEAGAAVRAWLDEVDIYLQPSFQEGLPRALIEAMSRGCLCVGSTAGGTPELLPRSRTHRPGDEPGLLGAIEAVLASTTEDQALESAANVEVANRYRPEEVNQSRVRSLLALRRLSAVGEA